MSSWIVPIIAMILVIVKWESKETWLRTGENCYMFALVKFNLMLVIIIYASTNFLVMIILYTVILNAIRRYVSNNLIIFKKKTKNYTFF